MKALKQPLALGFSGYARHPLSAGQRVALNWGISATRYETDNLNNLDTNLALVYERATRTGRWFLSPYYRKTSRPENTSHRLQGLRLGMNSRLTVQDQLHFTLLRERRIFPNHLHLEGPFASALLNLSHQLSPSRSIQLSLGVERSSPQSEHLPMSAPKYHSAPSKTGKAGYKPVLDWSWDSMILLEIIP